MRKISFSEGPRYIAAFGNENILRNHVYYFEKHANDEIQNNLCFAKEVSFSTFPNFTVWLRLYSELICNSLYWRLFRYQGDKDIFKPWKSNGFQPILESIIKIIKENDKTSDISISEEIFGQMKKSINLVFNLRHSFQHGGLPNLLRDLSCDCDEMEFYNMLIPNNISETKKIFNQAEALVKMLPQPTIVCYAK